MDQNLIYINAYRSNGNSVDKHNRILKIRVSVAPLSAPQFRMFLQYSNRGTPWNSVDTSISKLLPPKLCATSRIMSAWVP